MSLTMMTLRRNWTMVGAIAAFLVFTIVHFAFFKPAAARYQTALARVGGLEAVFDPGGTRPMLPPRVFSLITEHSLDPQDALERGGSGALGVVLLEDLGRLASRAGLRVESSEPLPVTQQPLSVQVRAQLTLRGRYAQIIAFFDEIDRSNGLLLVDRFRIAPLEDGSNHLQVWITQLYLKSAASAR